MSARVANPFSLNEMRLLREAVVARPVSFRPDPEARARVCRNLYGRPSAADRAFAARELAEQRERASDRWGFDFLREVPRNHGPGAERYKWAPVKIGSVSSAYRMRHLAPKINLDAVLETARATVPSLVRDSTPPTSAVVPESISTAETASPLTAESSPTVRMAMASPDLASPPSAAPSTTVPTRQTTMKDFLVCRKRPLSRKAEESIVRDTTNPAKRQRTV